MKNLKLIATSLFAFALVFQSCEDLEEVNTPEFTISQITKTGKVGEPVEFKVENSSDFLRFYSGEFGHEYKYKDRINAEGIVTMSFIHAQKWGVGTNKKGTLSVWYSRDYDGSGTPEAVNNASWTEISDRFNITELYDFTPQDSGLADITDLGDGAPIYFGFKYFSDNVADRGAEWYFTSVTIGMNVEGAAEPIAVLLPNVVKNMAPVDVQGINSGWSSAKWYWDSAKTLWRMRGNSHRIINEDWLITGSVNLTAVNPDRAKSLKTFAAPVENFTHTYNTAGTYTATVVGNNTTIHGNQEKVVEFTITVE